jgi:hypothetical protein
VGEVHPGPRNPNWKGGRTVDPRGYVLIKKPEHHAADVRGYVYEHRLVAEAKLGRPLARGEVVHHVNEDKGDNRPENLAVLPSIAHHRKEHRKPGSKLRDPDEANPMVRCACGCGARLRRYDSSGRPRRFVSGHNGRTVARG